MRAPGLVDDPADTGAEVDRSAMTIRQGSGLEHCGDYHDILIVVQSTEFTTPALLEKTIVCKTKDNPMILPH